MQPAKLKTLDDLLAQAEDYANYSMRKFGQMPPALFLTGPADPLMFMAKSLADDPAKDEFAATARLMCVANAATSIVTAFEAWVRFAVPGEKLDENEPPSEAIDRREFVIDACVDAVIKATGTAFSGSGTTASWGSIHLGGQSIDWIPLNNPNCSKSDS